MNWVIQKPGPSLTRVMAGIFAVWLAFAIALNWADASRNVFYSFCGNTRAILSGEIWRLLTAPLMHEVQGSIGHILATMLGLFFLAPSLEERWGGKRLVRFLYASAVLSYVFQMLAEFILPASVVTRLIPPFWYGAVPVVEAVVVAFALTFPGREVRLFFVLPVTSRALILMTGGFNVLMLIVGATSPSGTLALFGGMASGWLLGGGSPSPLRRAWLRYRLRRLDEEARRDSRPRRARPADWRVIEGGDARRKRDSDRGSNGGTLH